MWFDCSAIHEFICDEIGTERTDWNVRRLKKRDSISYIWHSRGKIATRALVFGHWIAPPGLSRVAPETTRNSSWQQPQGHSKSTKAAVISPEGVIHDQILMPSYSDFIESFTLEPQVTDYRDENCVKA